ncbi:DinB family protein [candidate division KSB1 bacterium]|nr:DinB family protein [candidate division KSB1 bacterium]
MIAPENKLEVTDRYREGPALLEDAVRNLTDADLDATPSAGGWSIRQIVHHIVDGDDIWKLYIKMALGNEQAEFSLGWYWEMSQQTWGDRWAYSRRSLVESLSFLKASRTHILQLLESIPDAWEHAAVVRKPDGTIEKVPVGYVIQMQADHVLHHIKRIREILHERGDARPSCETDAPHGS